MDQERAQETHHRIHSRHGTAVRRGAISRGHKVTDASVSKVTQMTLKTWEQTIYLHGCLGIKVHRLGEGSSELRRLYSCLIPAQHLQKHEVHPPSSTWASGVHVVLTLLPWNREHKSGPETAQARAGRRPLSTALGESRHNSLEAPRFQTD